MAKLISAIPEYNPPPPPAPPAKFTIEMTAEELATILIITEVIGGSPESTLRKYTQSLQDDLSSLRDLSTPIFWSSTKGCENGVKQLMADGCCSIYFKAETIDDPKFCDLVDALNRKALNGTLR